MGDPKLQSEKTMELLVEAVVRLLDRRGAGEISVRDIGAEAGVNHGLVHHYFGSKDALIREAVARTTARVNRDRPGAVASGWSFELFRAHPEFARILARVCLDGPHDALPLAAPSREVLDARAAALRAGAAHLGVPPLVEPHVASAVAASAILGWFVFRPLLAHFALPDDADEQVSRALLLIDEVLKAVGGTSGASGASGA